MADTQAAKASTALTPRDQEIIVAALHNAKGGNLEIEYDGMATELGLKDRKSAIASWSSLRKKLFGNSLDQSAPNGSPKTPRKTKDANTTTPKSSAKKTAKVVKAEDDESGEADSTTGVTDPGVQPSAGEANEGDEATVTAEAPATPEGPASVYTTPSSGKSSGKKRGRKTKAEKEAEAAASGEAPAVEGEEAEKPAKKPRKTPVKKKSAADSEATVVKEEESTTSVKGKKASTTPRKGATTKSVTTSSEAKVKEEKDATTAADASDVLPSTKAVAPDSPAAAAEEVTSNTADETTEQGQDVKVVTTVARTEAVVVPSDNA